ncbi:hypothetical protein FHR90_000124 [Endobacter medicaginis]|uniref:Ankyrin repeat domain-containing protein n=1 Tax=Endobacter medicaginis TaxID=1181271 RepID=A0A850NTK2_9PROT|nr:ankyrin repeat domain-containing protein [Endobacter medicaginis]MBB3172318.1 hypothetical protein [Endobacter medicaginis]MCX5474563.1 ankyrin repeat domain-containing protein [Endobacter medicaginis]NVN30695.1 ankyrin repeat domain-containing protein [Endobacter medicaginis]
MTDPVPATSLPPMERMVEMMFDAARQGREDVIDALLRAGVDIEVLDSRGFSPLIIASYNDQPGATRLLLDRGACPDGPAEFAGNTALMGVAFKGYLPIAELLIARGADVNHRNGAGQTALMTAAMFGRDDIIELFLAHGGDPSIADHAGNTAKSLAAMQNNVELVERFG